MRERAPLDVLLGTTARRTRSRNQTFQHDGDGNRIVANIHVLAVLLKLTLGDINNNTCMLTHIAHTIARIYAKQLH